MTFTRDVLADLLHEPADRFHEDLPVEDVIMPRDVLDAMADRLGDAPVFSNTEAAEFEDRVVPVKNYVLEEQEADVLDAVMAQKRVDDETVEEYVEHVYAWDQGETIANERGEAVAPDPLKMKVFEVEHLGRFDEADYEGAEPSAAVEAFRSEQVITALNRQAWAQRDEEFRVAEVDPTDIPVIETVLASHDWDAVRRTFEDFDPRQWANPPEGTETAQVKADTIRAMQDRFGYSEAAAELTSRHVMEQVSYQWD